MTTSERKTTVVALAILGVCDGLKNSTLDLLLAEKLVFSPHAMRVCADCDQRIVEAIHLGTELDDIRDLVPDDYENTLRRIHELATACLKETPESTLTEENHWIDTVK